MRRIFLCSIAVTLGLQFSSVARADSADDQAEAMAQKFGGITERDSQTKVLTEIQIIRKDVKDDDLKALVGCKNLTKVVLFGCKQITDGALKHLAGLSTLQRLDLTETPINGSGLKELAGLKKLTELILHSVELTDEGAKSLPELTSVKHIVLQGCTVTPGICKSIAKMKNLDDLDLTAAVVADDCLKELEANKSIKTIDLWNARKMTDAGLASLSKMKQLKSLNIKEIGLSKKAVADFKKAVPNCSVDYK